MADSAISFSGPIEVASPNVTYTAETITSNYEYRTTDVSFEESKDGARRLVATPNVSTYQFKTQRTVPRMGLMVVGYVVCECGWRVVLGGSRQPLRQPLGIPAQLCRHEFPCRFAHVNMLASSAGVATTVPP